MARKCLVRSLLNVASVIWLRTEVKDGYQTSYGDIPREKEGHEDPPGQERK